MADGDQAVECYFRTGFRNTVLDAMRERPGWMETDGDDFDFYWCHTEYTRTELLKASLLPHQRVSHFPRNFEMTRKDHLVKNVRRMRRALEKAGELEEAAQYEFLPTSFVLPGDYALFVEHFKSNPGSAWIMKPVGKAQGRGIFLFTKLSEIAKWKRDASWQAGDKSKAETYVVQRYIERPYLIGGKKFDLRIYCLATSFNPLVVWLYRTGFSRFSGTRYSSDRAGFGDLFKHLTNVAIQKTADDYDREQGCKISIREIKMFMASKHGMPAVDRLFAEIQALIVRTLLSVQKVVIHHRNCFELYGFDVIIDADLKPWLLEVNASPAMTADGTDADYLLKRSVLRDTLDVIDMEGRRSGEERQWGGWDMIWDAEGPVESPLPGSVGSCLGAFNPTLAALQRDFAQGRVVNPKRQTRAAATQAVEAPATGAGASAAAAAGGGGGSGV